MVKIGNRAVYNCQEFHVRAILGDNICIENQDGHTSWVMIGQAFVYVDWAG